MAAAGGSTDGPEDDVTRALSRLGGEPGSPSFESGSWILAGTALAHLGHLGRPVRLGEAYRFRADRHRRPGRADRAGGAPPLRPARGGAGAPLRHADAAGRPPRVRLRGRARPAVARAGCRPPARCDSARRPPGRPRRSVALLLDELHRTRRLHVVEQHRRMLARNVSGSTFDLGAATLSVAVTKRRIPLALPAKPLVDRWST
jgi:hypothetical protein